MRVGLKLVRENSDCKFQKAPIVFFFICLELSQQPGTQATTSPQQTPQDQDALQQVQLQLQGHQPNNC